MLDLPYVRSIAEESGSAVVTKGMDADARLAPEPSDALDFLKNGRECLLAKPLTATTDEQRVDIGLPHGNVVHDRRKADLTWKNSATLSSFARPDQDRAI